MRIFLALSMFPDVGSMSRVGKVQWAVKTKSLFSVAIADLGIVPGSKVHRDVLSALLKAVSDRLQIEEEKLEGPCSRTEKADTSDRVQKHGNLSKWADDGRFPST